MLSILLFLAHVTSTAVHHIVEEMLLSISAARGQNFNKFVFMLRWCIYYLELSQKVNGESIRRCMQQSMRL